MRRYYEWCQWDNYEMLWNKRYVLLSISFINIDNFHWTSKTLVKILCKNSTWENTNFFKVSRAPCVIENTKKYPKMIIRRGTLAHMCCFSSFFIKCFIIFQWRRDFRHLKNLYSLIQRKPNNTFFLMYLSDPFFLYYCN